MGLFKRLFHGKKRTEEQMTERFDAVLLPESGLSKEADHQRQIGHHVLDHCEQIIEAARELDETKKEYDIVTRYLEDIETLTGLPDEKKNELSSIAEQLCRLNEKRNDYLNTSKKISDTDYVMMERMQDEIPDAIRRLQTNEAYQTTVKSDMSYLEGEKMQWTLLRNSLLHEKYVLRIASYLVFSVFFLLLVLLAVLQAGFSVDVTWGWIVVAVLAAGGGFFILIRYQNARSGIARAELNANHAIALLNRTKIKYVNITNAVDYACEKYHVKGSRELNYRWQQYQEALREKERYERANDEFGVYSHRLTAKLQEYELYDAKVWCDQPQALMKSSEMSELKHNLLVRRQKLRARIQYHADMVESERGEVDQLMKQHPEYEDKIRDIVRSVDELSIDRLL